LNRSAHCQSGSIIVSMATQRSPFEQLGIENRYLCVICAEAL
jgi:hypothetical protein